MPSRKRGKRTLSGLHRRDIHQLVPIFDEEMMMLGNVGVEIGFRAVDRHLPQEADFGKLMQRVVNGRKRHRNPRPGRLLVKHFRRQVAVALAEQYPAECHALQRRT